MQRFKLISLKPPIIYPLMSDHGLMVDLVRARKATLNSMGQFPKIVIFNADAHDDKYHGTWDIQHISSWARVVEREFFAKAIHLPSYWREGDHQSSTTNWNSQEYRQSIIDQLTWINRGDSEFWLTIDFDFFSLVTSVSHPYSILPHSQFIYDFYRDTDRITQELQQLKLFFKQNNLPLSRIVPAVSEEWLAMGLIAEQEISDLGLSRKMIWNLFHNAEAEGQRFYQFKENAIQTMIEFSLSEEMIYSLGRLWDQAGREKESFVIDVEHAIREVFGRSTH
jgi:hypothetical protein